MRIIYIREWNEEYGMMNDGMMRMNVCVSFETKNDINKILRKVKLV